MNPYHKPAGHHTPITDPTPIYKLSVPERFALMFSDTPTPIMKQRLLDLIASIEDPALRQTCEVIPTTQDFLSWPAAISFHHNYEGGLLAHTVEVCDYALNSAAAMRGPVNIDVLIAAALWHDMMKIRDYSLHTLPAPPPGYILIRSQSNEGVTFWQKDSYADTIGHICGGASMFEILAFNNGVTRDIRDAVVHCILSHHGRREWGSPVEPRSLEALLLHQADMVSAKYGATKDTP